MTRLVFLMTLGWLAAGVAHAADTPAKTGRLEEIKIVGKIQKPEIEILITKQKLTPPYELTLNESFLPKVIESVESKPF